MKQFIWFFLFACCFQTAALSQSKFVIQNKKESDKIRFKLINNLIIIPVEINGVALSFILDTGVNKTIIFNFLNISDSLQIRNTETIFLRGLGEGEAVKALRSTRNFSKIGDAINLDQELYAVYSAHLDFAPRLGIPLHGIIGYDLFKDFVVEINYVSKYIRLTNPKVYKYKSCRSCEILPMEFYKNKPYIYADVNIRNKQIPVKLLIDSGGSDALWLFQEDSLGIEVGDMFFDDFLGHGLTGSVYGKRSRISEVSLNSFTLEDVNVSFPNSESLIYVKQHKDRNGSVAGELLKRFNLIVDYSSKTMTLKKNKYFKTPFSYNKSGIELAQNTLRLSKEKNYDHLSQNDFMENNTAIILNPKYKLTLKPAYSIVELRKDSPADRAGLKLNDVLLTINNRSTDRYTLQEITHMFYGKAGQRIKLEVERAGVVMDFVFYLEDVFKP